jgi:HAD superfamily phosphoserine phosphatase-like hydrolase
MNPSPPPVDAFLTAPAWPPEIARAAERMIRGGAGSIAVFDFDQTCIYGDISEMLLALVAEDRGQDLVAEYDAHCARDLRGAYIELVFTLTEGLTEREARAQADRAFHEGARRGQLAIREPMRELVWALHRHGWEVWVVTASAEVLVQAVAERMGIHPHRVLGMRAPLDASGRYRGVIEEPAPFREGKLELLRKVTGRDPRFAAGDSRSDAWLMGAAEDALLVDRGDAALRQELIERGGWIVDAERFR